MNSHIESSIGSGATDGGSRVHVIGAAIAFVLVIGLVDYATGSEASVALLYLAPIAIATWSVGLRAGLLVCGLSAVVRLQDVWWTTRHLSPPFTSYWNGAVELGFFVVLAVILARLRSVTEHAAALGTKDALTGVLNREAFAALAARELDRAERYHQSLSLVCIDVDALGKVNAEGGEEDGDRLLVELAATLERSLRSSDLLARYGGDEFVILLPEAGDEAAKKTILKLAHEIRRVLAGRWLTGVSVGAVTIQAPRTSLDRLIHQVYNVVGAAKDAGGNGMRHRHLHRTATPEGDARPVLESLGRNLVPAVARSTALHVRGR